MMDTIFLGMSFIWLVTLIVMIGTTLWVVLSDELKK